MATFVLVHGAWAGGVVWRQLAAMLRQAGHEVYAPTLTGLGERKHLLDREISLETHIQDVIGVIDDEDLSDVILVGHSYGGIVISAVADRLPDKIGSLVYLDAIVPENGQSVFNLLQLPSENGFVSPIPSTAFGLKRPEVIAFWEAKSTPQPLATFTQPVRLAGGMIAVKQKIYILATDPACFNGFFTAFYDKVKDDPGWTVHTMPCSHFIQLEMPRELTAILMTAFSWKFG